MHERSALGAADVDDETLTGFVAELLGRERDEVELLDSRADEVPYEIPAITTASRTWVRGHARVAGSTELPYSFFVKQVQSWARSPLFASVPPEFREMAESMVPWRTEPAVYRTNLREVLPAGLSMARCFGVIDLDEKSSAIWLEEVPASTGPWDLARFEQAARALGRLAASPQVAEYADVGGHEWTVRDYLDGRLSVEVLPLLRSDDVWSHPLVATIFEPALRARLVEAADRAPAYVEELMQLPVGTGHGDACPGNMLVRPGSDEFVLIDFGFWKPLTIGHDLGQLLVGDVQLGRRTSEDLAERDELCLAAYVAGLREEGCEVPHDEVRRAHALQMLIFTGYSVLPIEYAEPEPGPGLRALAAERAALARYCLDLLEATA